MTDLSARGQKLASSSPMPEYVREHFARTSMDDYVPLCVAENKLASDLLLAKMSTCRDVPPSVLGYDRMRGSDAFRAALVDFMGRMFLGRRFSPEQVLVLAGAGTVLEILFHVIADPGDGVLIPTPSYPGFWLDLETRDELSVIPVPTESADGFRLTPARLDAALAAAPRPVRALLFTSPDNPLGRVYSRAEIQSVIDWARGAGIHLVMDEIYALSVHGEREFVSAASLGPLGDRVHLVWAFSKDFGASGLRAGVLVSENEEVLRAMDELAYWACCSGDTQWLLGRMISDRAWVDGFVRENGRRLGEAKRAVTQALDKLEVPYIEPAAGFFLLLDVRRFLRASTPAAEHALWRRLLEEANVNLTPGAACRVGEPGFMRLCFAAVPTDVVVRAVERIGRVLRG
jgi:aspartate/methionine/tyrosine aminotransferase